MEGLPTALNELWVCECKLEIIDDLVNLTKVERLHLYDAGLASVAVLGQLKVRGVFLG